MIQVSPFLGMIPKISDRLIPETHATLASQCDLESMSLRPARAPLNILQVAADTKSIYKHPLGTWFRWSAEGVDMTLSPLNDDAWSRLYWTGDGSPKMAAYASASGGSAPPSSGLRLGIPEPAQSPTATASGAGEPPEGAIEIDTVYTYTYVSAYGEEGPPSAPSQMVTRWDGKTVTVSGMSAPPTGSHNFASKRIYRAETGGTYLFVSEIPASNTTFNDNINTENLGRPLESLDWDMPDNRMKGLRHIGNGIMAGWFENTLCFCEPYRPHAWPVGYQLGFESDIVGIAPVSGGLIVITQQAPWLVSGVSPAAMSQSKLDVHLGGVSRRSVVDMGEYAIYASSEGLVAIGGGQAQVITQNILTRDQWQSYNPASIFSFRWHEKYLAFYQRENGARGAFLLHPEQGLIHYPSDAVSGWFDPASGEVYTVSAGGQVASWGRGSAQQYQWRSKMFTLPRRATMPSAKVDGLQSSSSPVTLRIWADDTLLHQEAVTNDRMIRLPSGRYRNWQFEITGTAEVFSVQIAPSPTFLR